VIEAHHNQKVDAPSGTARDAGRRLREGRVLRCRFLIAGATGITVPRKRGGNMGFSGIRAVKPSSAAWT